MKKKLNTFAILIAHGLLSCGNNTQNDKPVYTSAKVDTSISDANLTSQKPNVKPTTFEEPKSVIPATGFVFDDKNEPSSDLIFSIISMHPQIFVYCKIQYSYEVEHFGYTSNHDTDEALKSDNTIKQGTAFSQIQKFDDLSRDDCYRLLDDFESDVHVRARTFSNPVDVRQRIVKFFSSYSDASRQLRKEKNLESE